jgi:hypothetical protein
MRELNSLELEAVAGAAQPAPRPTPLIPTTIFGVRLSRGDRRLLAAIVLALRPVKAPA